MAVPSQQVLFEEPTLTVAQLSAGIATALSRAFPDEIWVRGEIVDINRPASGHVYFTLAGDGAAIAVTLWASDRLTVNRVLRRAGDAVRMTDGTEVRIRARVNWYAKRGSVSLQMLSIDTAYTLGRLAEAREVLVMRLTADGLLARQRSLALAPVPLRVGLVTSDQSAAQADFLHTLEASGFAWMVVMADARVQGAGAEASLVAGIRDVATAGVDVICVVRGGGARTDLAAFDAEPLARAIATTTVPVLTGIGHETDTAVADLVAHRPFKTPTACAGFLVERVQGYLLECGAAWTAVQRRARVAVDGAGATIERAGGRVTGVCGHHLRSRDHALGHAAARLAAQAPRLCDRADRALEGRAARVAALDPARLLARGWTITHDAQGRLVRYTGEVAAGDALVTTLADGTVRSRVL